MKLFIEFMAGVVAFLAALAMSQMGIDMNRASQPKEIKRLPSCHAPANDDTSATKSTNC